MIHASGLGVAYRAKPIVAAASRARVDHADLTALDKLLAQAARAGRGEAWLAEHGLAGQAPLWRQLDIQPGWETAVEAALAPLLSARAVDDWPSDAPPSRLALLARHADEPAAEAEPLPLPTLASKLSLRAPELTGALADWLDENAHLGDTMGEGACNSSISRSVAPAARSRSP